jgi:uncharacterized protein
VTLALHACLESKKRFGPTLQPGTHDTSFLAVGTKVVPIDVRSGFRSLATEHANQPYHLPHQVRASRNNKERNSPPCTTSSVHRIVAPWTRTVDAFRTRGLRNIPYMEGDMTTAIGQIEAIFRHPVKSMRGESLDAATLDWHGIEGDRRLAFRRVGNSSDFPWLYGSLLPELTWFTPFGRDDDPSALPTHVRTPEGKEMELFGNELATEVGRRHGAPVQMMRMKHGIFDEASISVITSTTIREICQLANKDEDARRFRPNILVRSVRNVPFEEDEWLGGVLSFDNADDAPAVTVTRRDLRCSMVNIDPEGGLRAPEVLKACVRANENNAGVYGAVLRIGRISVGQTVFFHPK